MPVPHVTGSESVEALFTSVLAPSSTFHTHQDRGHVTSRLDAAEEVLLLDPYEQCPYCQRKKPINLEAAATGRVSGKSLNFASSRYPKSPGPVHIGIDWGSDVALPCAFCDGKRTRVRKTYFKACKRIGLSLDREPVYFRLQRFTHLGATDAHHDEARSSGGDSDWTLHRVPPLWWLRVDLPIEGGQSKGSLRERIQHLKQQVPQLPRNWALAPRKLPISLLHPWSRDYIHVDYRYLETIGLYQQHFTSNMHARERSVHDRVMKNMQITKHYGLSMKLSGS